MTSFLIGLYLGIGLGYAGFTLAEVGLGRGWSLTWRVSLLILFWPGIFFAAVARRI